VTCNACHQRFIGSVSLSAHRVGSGDSGQRRCLSAEELQRLGNWRLTRKGWSHNLPQLQERA
jgi:hypothetical protein